MGLFSFAEKWMLIFFVIHKCEHLADAIDKIYSYRIVNNIRRMFNTFIYIASLIFVWSVLSLPVIAVNARSLSLEFRSLYYHLHAVFYYHYR